MYTPKVVELPYSHECLMFWHFLSNRMCLLHKGCHNHIKSWSQSASWFTKDHKGHKVYCWTRSLQFLCHANVIMPSVMWLEFSNSRVAATQVTKMLQYYTLFIHMHEGLGTQHAVSGLCILTLSFSVCIELLHRQNKPDSAAYRDRSAGNSTVVCGYLWSKLHNLVQVRLESVPGGVT